MQEHYVEDLAEACGEGGRIVAFVQDTVAIKKLMQSLGRPDYTAPPPLRRLTPFDEHLFVDDIPDYE